MQNCPHEVVEGDPAPRLFSASDHSAGTQFEWQQHFFQSSTFRAEHDADPKIDHADARVGCRCRCVFPGLTEFADEPRARRRGFGHHFVAAVSVKTDRRSAHKDFRRIAHPGKSPSQQASAFDPAVFQQPLHSLRPATVSDVVSAEMNDRVAALKARRIDRSFGRVPVDRRGVRRAATSRVRSGECQDLVPAGRQKRDEGRTDQTGRTSDCDFHR